MNPSLPSLPLPLPPARAPRSDGIDSRERLLHAALRLFAEKGFAKTSTREIAQAAGANIAAISYYFGDKAGLYAATFTEPMGGNVGELIALFDVPGQPIEQALRLFMTAYLEPLKRGEIVRQCMRLHMRELVEPTSQFLIEIERDIKGPHQALMRVLCRHLGLKAPDHDIHRLAISVTGLAIQLFVMQDVIDTLNPSLLGTSHQIDTWADRLASYALAMVATEAARRGKSPVTPARKRASPTARQTPPPVPGAPKHPGRPKPSP